MTDGENASQVWRGITEVASNERVSRVGAKCVGKCLSHSGWKHDVSLMLQNSVQASTVSLDNAFRQTAFNFLHEGIRVKRLNHQQSSKKLGEVWCEMTWN